MNPLNRRQFLAGALVAPLSGAALVLQYPPGSARERPGAPLSRSFCPQNTAEDVTTGIDLTGKTVLITGCNAGIGYETARVLAMRGAHVLGLARNLDKARQACASISKLGVKGTLTPFACEHTDFASVVSCTQSVCALNSPLDIVICNAGVYFLPQLELAQGLEKQFVVNHLSHFLLVNRLWTQIYQAPQARVVVVGSDYYRFAPKAGIDFNNLSGQRRYDPYEMYAQSKLAKALFGYELARRLSRTDATANVVHPGWVLTETMRSYIAQHTDKLAITDQKSPERGAATVCYVATNPTLAKANGKYFEDCHESIPEQKMRDSHLAAKLWAVSEALTRPYLDA
jgi:NAD(P)-dependent dehydrogenase (short-subunit alcohol dehydrogenase family)